VKVLLICENKDIRELLSFQISSGSTVKVKEIASAREGVELLTKENGGFDLLVAPFTGPASVLVEYLKNLKTPLPVIFYFDPPINVPDKKSLPGILMIDSVEQSKLPQLVNGIVQDFVKSGGVTSQELEFCPIRTNLLVRVSPLKSDIYIRLSAEKYVKLFRTGDEFDQQDLERYYREKAVEYMYLRRAETAEFIQKFRSELDQLLIKPDLKPIEALETAEVFQEAIHELVQRVGFNEQVQELAKKNVQFTLKAIGAYPRLSDVVKRVINDGNYISQHSTLLAHVSCCVAKEMAWGSESTFSKLVFASYMHDISVSSPELARMNSIKDMEARKADFPPDETKSYHLHPARSADVVRSFKEIPADVDIIVQQHHERPNSSGFPRGLAHNHIAPLSALFIIAHELTQYILTLRKNFSMEDFIDEKKPNYSQGNFKKVMTALGKVKL
jgi:HD-GYP domain-containing protein (c-di-GMP phosphodiesterase class II)